jgi:hypothetical protein
MALNGPSQCDGHVRSWRKPTLDALILYRISDHGVRERFWRQTRHAHWGMSPYQERIVLPFS